MLDVREIIRRLQLGEGIRSIAQELSISRNTVRAYKKWAQDQGVLKTGSLPHPGEIEQLLQRSSPPPPPLPSGVEPYREFVTQKRQEGVEMKALLGLLRERGFAGSYSALWRFVHRVEIKLPQVFIRVETEPAKEAQVDFGYAGLFMDPADGRLRKSWVFVMTLSYSRHQYAEIVFDQKVETWIALHIRAFEFFGGVPEKIVLDNLKAGIIKALWHDSEAQRSYAELAGHYEFLISPCKPRTPRHKGKVESGVHYVIRNGLAGRVFPHRDAANEHLIKWIIETAGPRDHGTTHEAPLARFQRERPALKPLPPNRYIPSVWKQAKLHPDCHVVFEGSYYSAPHRLVGQSLWLQVTPESVIVYHRHERLATHPRAKGRGVRVSQQDHLPPEKIQGLLTTWEFILSRAGEIGPKTRELVERLREQRPMDRMRTAQAIVSLAKRFTAARVEAACARAIAFDEAGYRVIKKILLDGLDSQPIQDPAAQPPRLPKTSTHARPVSQQIPLPGKAFSERNRPWKDNSYPN